MRRVGSARCVSCSFYFWGPAVTNARQVTRFPKPCPPLLRAQSHNHYWRGFRYQKWHLCSSVQLPEIYCGCPANQQRASAFHPARLAPNRCHHAGMIGGCGRGPSCTGALKPCNHPKTLRRRGTEAGRIHGWLAGSKGVSLGIINTPAPTVTRPAGTASHWQHEIQPRTAGTAIWRSICRTPAGRLVGIGETKSRDVSERTNDRPCSNQRKH